MRSLILIILLAATCRVHVAQEYDYYGYPASVKFIQHLWCGQDYLRAALETDRLMGDYRSDTLLYIAGITRSRLGLYDSSSSMLKSITMPHLRENASLIILGNSLMQRKRIPRDETLHFIEHRKEAKQLLALEVLYRNENQQSDTFSNNLFDTDADNHEYGDLLALRKDPPYRSPALAMAFSTFIPGAGKMYAGYVADGLTALVLTGVTAVVGYLSFRDQQYLRGTILTAASLFFYGGGLYGSYEAAENYNLEAQQQWMKRYNHLMQRYSTIQADQTLLPCP